MKKSHGGCCPVCGEKMREVEVVALTPKAARILAECDNFLELSEFDEDGSRLFKFAYSARIFFFLLRQKNIPVITATIITGVNTSR